MFKKVKKIEKVLDVGQGVIDDITQLTCFGNSKIILSNYIGIIEYEDYLVRLNTHQGIIIIYGDNLQISELTLDEIMVCGKIHSIEFEGKAD